jgi:hypothetical protein
MAMMKAAVIVKIMARDFFSVSAGGSRSDIQWSPALRGRLVVLRAYLN